MRRFVEYETSADLRSAVEKLDERDFKGQSVRCVADVRARCVSYHELSAKVVKERPRDRYRSRSPPPPRRGYPSGPNDYYTDRRGPRGYSPRRDDYRRRTPPMRDYYERDRYGRSPPRARGPPTDDYGPPRGRYADDAYDSRPAPRRGYDPDPYVSSRGPYDRPPSPRRMRSPAGRAGYDGGYDRRSYW